MKLLQRDLAPHASSLMKGGAAHQIGAIFYRTNETRAVEVRRRTYDVRIFPNTESCLRLVRAFAVGWRPIATSTWTLREHKKLALRQAA